MDLNFYGDFVVFGIFIRIICISLVYSTSYEFHFHERFRDMYCTNGVEILGIHISAILCTLECSLSTSCTGIFYNHVTKNCSTVKVVSVPENGCLSETGSDYYVRMSYEIFEPYTLTADDVARLSTESAEQVCNSYNYHTWNSDVGATKTACGTSQCCKSKGCHSGTPHEYKGTWSKTATGRTCQRWDTHSPHVYSFIYIWETHYPGDKPTKAQNYCGDPKPEGLLWCYTMDPNTRWETCDVPACP